MALKSGIDMDESLKEAVIKGRYNVTVWKDDIQKVFLIWRNIMDWSMTKTYDRSDVSCDLICSVCSLCVFLEYDWGEYI